ncbi:YihY/virulence factor BrkB family protein [Tenggerimyces flavus]|uniref:YihY/virulence factor BrkB family protein n=1 Tax=Tenggerimyces flavus TaxID=1708749 RepID=A0ABV7Y560_9ACTN|nr:YihY/virulence factor BrkB family protein [Tenggerimyces flavus]MBM7790866.1 membrane protein [Tenggerimyces flavus]
MALIMNVQRLKQRALDTFERVKARWPVVDHAVRAGSHYGDRLGSQLAAAVTYFGFLSFFPIIALAFAVVGYVVAYVPGADAAVESALSSIFPGMIGDASGQINVAAIASRRGSVGLIGLVGLLYSGLGWISALRTSLQSVFDVVAEEGRNFLLGKLFDLIVLGVIGLVLVLSVTLGTAVTGFTDTVIGWIGLSGVPGMGTLLTIVAMAVGIAASTLLFFTMYRLLPKHNAPTRSVWQGALIAAVGFEILKQLAGLVIGNVTGNPLYGAFAIMIALLVWINYFARLVVLGASWAATATLPEESTEEPELEPKKRKLAERFAAVAAVGVLATRRSRRT